MHLLETMLSFKCSQIVSWILVLSLWIQISDALHCYNKATRNDEESLIDCSEKLGQLDSTSKFACFKDDNQNQKSCVKVNKSKDMECVHQGGKSRSVRQAKNTRLNSHNQSVKPKQPEVCYCDTDQCNHSYKMALSNVLVVVGIGVSISIILFH